MQDKAKQTKVCPKCGNKEPENYLTCKDCGIELVPIAQLDLVRKEY